MFFSFTRTGIQAVDDVIRVIVAGLRRLSFVENFDAFQVSVTIPANSELKIRNVLQPQTIPTSFLLTNHSGAIILKGSTEWSKEWVYLRNASSTSTATADVVFFR